MILIGGSNVDFTAISSSSLIRHDSNIGSVKVSFGGVMRNIAENLARLNERVFFVTAMGDDLFGRELKENLESLGVSVLTPQHKEGMSTPTYVAILDSDSDMDVAVCDAKLTEAISPFDIDAFDPYIRKEEIIAVDCNLSEETISYVLDKYKDKKIVLETVSANKCVRAKDSLDGLYLLKCNLLEARYLLGEEEISPEEAVEKLHEKGVQNIVVSNGSKPITVCENGAVFTIDTCISKHPVSYSGCGDALTAGILRKLSENRTLKEAVLYGSKLAALTSETEGPCNPRVSYLA